MIVGWRKKNLGFMLQAPESFAMNNAIDIALKAGANEAIVFRPFTPLAGAGATGKGREAFFFKLFK
jgi:hypothetical protein